MTFRKGLALLSFVWILAGISYNAFSQVPKWKALEAERDTLYNQQDYKGAIGFYTKAIELNKMADKDIYRTIYKRAVSYYSVKDFSNAIKDIDLFIPEYPSVPQARLLKAFIYREMGDDEKQLVSLEEAMILEPPGPDLLKWRGMLYLQKNDYGKAKKDILQARLIQDDPEIETYLGLCYHNLQQKDSSLLSFNKSIELDATYLPAYLYAGSASLENGDHALALEYLNLALRLESKNKEAIFYKGVALIELKRRDEGCRCLNRAFYAGMDDAGDYLKEYCFHVDD